MNVSIGESIILCGKLFTMINLTKKILVKYEMSIPEL